MHADLRRRGPGTPAGMHGEHVFEEIWVSQWQTMAMQKQSERPSSGVVPALNSPLKSSSRSKRKEKAAGAAGTDAGVPDGSASKKSRASARGSSAAAAASSDTDVIDFTRNSPDENNAARPDYNTLKVSATRRARNVSAHDRAPHPCLLRLLPALQVAQLKSLCEQHDIKIPSGAKKAVLVEALAAMHASSATTFFAGRGRQTDPESPGDRAEAPIVMSPPAARAAAGSGKRGRARDTAQLEGPEKRQRASSADSAPPGTARKRDVVVQKREQLRQAAEDETNARIQKLETARGNFVRFAMKSKRFVLSEEAASQVFDASGIVGKLVRLSTPKQIVCEGHCST